MEERPTQTWSTAAILGVLSVLVIGTVWLWGGEALASLRQRPARILFASERDVEGNWELFVTDLDGGEAQNVSNNPAIDRYMSWSPASQTVAFASDREAQDPEVFVMRLDGSEPQNVSQNPLGVDFLPNISPDGRYVAYVSLRQEGQFVVLADLESNHSLVVGSSSADQLVEFAWSPLSDAFVYTSLAPTGQSIFLVDAASGEQSELTGGPGTSNLTPFWSPDGLRLVFASDRDGSLDLYLIDRDGGNLANLTNTPDINEGFPEWSPTGGQIVFLTDEPGAGALDIFTINIDGSERTNLTNTDTPEADFHWSPDGSKILYHTLDEGDLEVFVMDADGGNPRNITHSAGRDLDAIWIQ